MPMYKFQCKNKKCGHIYSDLVNMDHTGKYSGVKCPKCNSKKKAMMVSVGNFIFAEPEGTSRYISEATGHDYRYKHKQKSVRKEREEATKRSHMGDNPYNPIDDVSSGKYFGEVK